MEKQNKKINLAKILMIIYFALLIWIILFKASFDITKLDRMRNINLIPFYYAKEASFHLSEVLKNLIIFIPLGIYLKINNISNKKSILIGLSLSAILELLQYIIGIGATDITDVITNTTGTICGVILYCLLIKLFNNKSKINKVLTILALIGTILFSLLFIMLLISNM